MQTEWANPLWHHVGIFGMIGFMVMVALVLVGRLWLKGRDQKRSKIAVELLGKIGGSRVAREVLSETSSPLR